MDGIVLSILTSVLGISLGAGSVVIIGYVKGKHTKVKAENIIEKARKEAERVKREFLFEAKESDSLQKNTAETEGLAWIPLEKFSEKSSEKEMRVIYDKIITRIINK